MKASPEKNAWFLVSVPAVLIFLVATSLAETRLLRFPDIHGNQIVFTYAGDLWLVEAEGGTARRLTAHPGKELFARFSPDGRWIAFTGQYDGDEQVYVIPSTGGVPRQLTFYPARGPLPDRWGYDHQVYGWTPDGRGILFRSLRDGWNLTGGRLFVVPLEGGLPEALPMPRSGAGVLAPDGRRLVYSPLFRDFRTWKRYEGGWAQDLYLFDLETLETRSITDHPRTDRDPMWIGEKVYFASDRDGRLNLYSLDPGDGTVTQVTHETEWDVRWPSSDGRNRIVYELNGRLHVLDVETGESRRVSVVVPDDGLSKRPSRVSASGGITSFGLSPKGERALFVARGDVFSAPIEHGPTRNLTRSSLSHDKHARWSPDGRRIAFISDRTGEEEIFVVAQDASSPPVQLTSGGRGMRYAPEWSPDGRHLAFSDKEGRLFVLDVENRETTEVARDRLGNVRDYVWAPRGGHLAFSLSSPHGFRSIYIWSLGDRELRQVTEDVSHESSPVWDPEGRYLYFIGAREFAPQISAFEWNFAINRVAGIFALALREDVSHPFPPRSDEVTLEEEAKADDAGKAPEESEESPSEESEEDSLRIDFEGLAGRIARVPVSAENYSGLSANRGHLIYVRHGASFYGRSPETQASLRIFNLEDRSESTLLENVNGYALSADGSRLLVREGGNFHLVPATGDGAAARKSVSTAGLQLDRVPREEWRQIFAEVWRRFRDFFYVENMHGYDWRSLKEQYRPLLDYVAHRSDLNYVIGEMIAELNVSHAYISGGDFNIPSRPQVGLPGARFELDPSAGRYRIVRIFRGQNEEERYRSPLTEIGVDAREGDYVLAIDGEELTEGVNPYEMLRHKADRPIRLTLNQEPSLEGAREVTFQPLTSETNLLYLEWTRDMRRRVEELSDGRVGYLHLPDMGADGIREFIKNFYGQLRKEGLVVDVRHNGGGNVSQMVLDRLNRELLGVGFARTSQEPYTYPAVVFHGHLAAILNEDTASDGDIFAYRFRKAGLGPLIGKRSWGGVVGITDHGPLIDGGSVHVPEFGTASPEGQWIIEGYGVDPDIKVENDPRSVIEGRDPQLERAVQEVLERIRQDPRRLPARPPDPVKVD